MKKTKLQKGITLVALIITIVILLILAVTTIAAIQKNDIIKYTKDANNEHIMGQEKEQIQLAYDSYKISLFNKSKDYELLEKYFLGENKEGININTLVDEKNSTDASIKFKNIDITITQSDLSYSYDGKIYILLNYNNNKYKLTTDAEGITKELELYDVKTNISTEQMLLEEYFLGENKEGINLNTLVDEENSTDTSIKFKNIDITITQSDLSYSSDEKNIYILLNYNNNKYKLTTDEEMITKELELYKKTTLVVDEAKVYGNGKPVWRIVFNETNNRYILNSNDGTINKEEDDDNWTIAWVSDGTKWSKEYTSEEVITEEYSVIAKLYKTGEILTYPNGEVGEEYHMTIEGNGEMAPLLSGSDLSTGEAWLKNINFQNPSFKWFGVTKLTIGEGITNIPYAAFVFGVWLNNVTLPSTLTSIDKEAFEGCVQLTEITIPDSVESIGKKCFYGCENLKPANIHYNGVATGRPWSAGTKISF